MVRVNRRRVVITDLGRIKSMVEPCVQHNMAMML